MIFNLGTWRKSENKQYEWCVSSVNTNERIKDVQGGHLMWVQDGTMIELFSSRISKQELITIAQSMQKL